MRRRRSRGWRAFCTVLATAGTLLLAATAGCGSSLDLGGSVWVGSPVWRPDGWIYFIGSASDDSEATGYLWRIKPDSSGEVVDFDYPGCEALWELVALFPIGDKGLGVGMICSFGEESDTVDFFELDVTDNSLVRLSQADLLDAVTWNADRVEGYAATNECRGGLVRLTGTGASCAHAAPSDFPIFAPSGHDVLYFLGSPCEVAGATTPGGSWTVCSGDLLTGEVRTVAGTFGKPSGFAVNPASTSAAVADGSAVWLVSLADGEVKRLEEGGGGVSFSPDGKQLAVTTWTRGPLLGYEAGLRVIDVESP